MCHDGQPGCGAQGRADSLRGRAPRLVAGAVAVAFGRIERLDEPTVRYRQHAGNQVGAVRWDLAHLARKASKLWDRGYLVEALAAGTPQATGLCERFGPELTARQPQVVEAFADLGRCGFFPAVAAGAPRLLSQRPAPQSRALCTHLKIVPSPSGRGQGEGR